MFFLGNGKVILKSINIYYMAKNKSMAEKLADLIEANPTCKFDIDNDCWYITEQGKENSEEDVKEIAESDEYSWNTDWYSYSNLYGAGLAEALVILLNRRGFDIEASAV